MIKRFYAPLIAAIVLIGAQVPTALHATTLTYNVTLTALSGPEGGGGSFTIDAPSSGSGILTQGTGLTALDFKIDNVDFGLNSSSAVSYFYQGANLILSGLAYGGQVGADTLFSIAFGSNGLYVFTDNAIGGSIYNTVGSVSISQTPLPASLPLLATGTALLLMMAWWRQKKVGSFLG